MALNNDSVKLLLAQRPVSQGYDGIRALCNYLLFQEKPTSLNLMPIDILVKENIEYYNEII